MKRTKSQFNRLLELDRHIRAGEYPNCLTFAAEWEVTQKTVQRDIDDLRDEMGAPIQYDRDRKGFYYEDKTWMLPSVLLSEGELLAVLLASRMLEQYRGSPVAKQVEGVFTKLAELLPEKLSIRPELLYSRFSFRGSPAKPVNAEVWATVVRGLLSQQTVRMAYRPFEGGSVRPGKESQVNPYHIANLQGEWYVFGVHRGHTDVRQFSMARIEKATLTSQHFDVSPDFDAERLLSPAFARYAGGGETHAVRLLFAREVADWVTEREWHPAQKLRRRKTGEIELEFPAKGLYEVQRWVLSWGHCVKVLAPNQLRKAVGDEIVLMGKRT